MNAMQVWADAWLQAKADEAAAIARRRECEDRMIAAMELDATKDGTVTVKPADGYVVKIVQRIDRKVDGEKVQELAAEFGLTEHLSSLFRWKPEINMAAWKAADESITKPLAAAITAKPGRPSFTITKE